MLFGRGWRLRGAHRAAEPRAGLLLFGGTGDVRDVCGPESGEAAEQFPANFSATTLTSL